MLLNKVKIAAVISAIVVQTLLQPACCEDTKTDRQIFMGEEHEHTTILSSKSVREVEAPFNSLISINLWNSLLNNVGELNGTFPKY